MFASSRHGCRWGITRCNPTEWSWGLKLFGRITRLKSGWLKNRSIAQRVAVRPYLDHQILAVRVSLHLLLVWVISLRSNLRSINHLDLILLLQALNYTRIFLLRYLLTMTFGRWDGGFRSYSVGLVISHILLLLNRVRSHLGESLCSSITIDSSSRSSYWNLRVLGCLSHHLLNRPLHHSIGALVPVCLLHGQQALELDILEMLLHCLRTQVNLLSLYVAALLIIIFSDVLVNLHLGYFLAAIQSPVWVGWPRNVGRVSLVGLGLEHYGLLLDLTSCLKLDATIVKVNYIGGNLRSLACACLASPLRLLCCDNQLRVCRHVGWGGVCSPWLSRALLLALLHQVRMLPFQTIISRCLGLRRIFLKWGLSSILCEWLLDCALSLIWWILSVRCAGVWLMVWF